MNKNKEKSEFYNMLLIFIRYVFLLLLIFSLPLIYKLLTPLTIYFSAGLLKLFFDSVFINGNTIIINQGILIEIIPACIAGSAYLLLLILNLSVPMNHRTRIYSILSSFLILFILNILRIFSLSILYYNLPQFFEFYHKLFWYGLSTIFVVGIWFFIIKIFSIKEIPVYSDIRYIIKIRKNHFLSK
jgi:exosortase/archaeosortase family protein